MIKTEIKAAALEAIRVIEWMRENMSVDDKAMEETSYNIACNAMDLLSRIFEAQECDASKAD